MSDHELEKLLGGFAADTLTAEERKLLYTAALNDQQLFNALADEQALKELLADPVVRHRLLQGLNQTRASGVGGSLSWLDWFRRPAGLAYAGGLTAAALAVVLGTKIYQDSLKQATQTVATEESKPASRPASAPSTSQPVPPQVAEPQLKAEENAAPAKSMAKKDAMLDKMAKREGAAPPAPQEQRASEPARDSLTQRSEQGETREQFNALVVAPGKTEEKVASSADQNLAASSAPATTPTPTPMQTPAGAPAAAGRSGPSARALFYQSIAEPTAEIDRLPQTATEERSPGAGAMAEAPQREKKRAEQGLGVVGKLQGSKRIIERPLGLRYSVIMTGPGGIDMEVDPTTSVGKDDAPRMAVQTNEDGYLTVLFIRPSSDQPTMLFPPSGDGRIAGRKTIAIALGKMFEAQQSTEQIRLLVTFSRAPHEVNIARLTDKKVLRQLTEQIDPGQPGAPAEQAVYVVNRDPSLAQLSVEIPLSLR